MTKQTNVCNPNRIAAQVPALVQLLDRHRVLEAGAYGIAFALVVVHALHVVGGMVPLSVLGWKARANRLDSEYLFSVRACVAYWHFLRSGVARAVGRVFHVGVSRGNRRP